MPAESYPVDEIAGQSLQHHDTAHFRPVEIGTTPNRAQQDTARFVCRSGPGRQGVRHGRRVERVRASGPAGGPMNLLAATQDTAGY